MKHSVALKYQPAGNGVRCKEIRTQDCSVTVGVSTHEPRHLQSQYCSTEFCKTFFALIAPSDFSYPMQAMLPFLYFVLRWLTYDGHVGAAEVVVNGADHADDVEVSVLVSLILRHLVLLLQLLHTKPN